MEKRRGSGRYAEVLAAAVGRVVDGEARGNARDHGIWQFAGQRCNSERLEAKAHGKAGGEWSEEAPLRPRTRRD